MFAWKTLCSLGCAPFFLLYFAFKFKHFFHVEWMLSNMRQMKWAQQRKKKAIYFTMVEVDKVTKLDEEQDGKKKFQKTNLPFELIPLLDVGDAQMHCIDIKMANVKMAPI